MNPHTTTANPMAQLGSKEKTRLILGGVAVLGLGFAAWYVSKRAVSLLPEPKDYGIDVDALCVNATVTDPERLRRALEDTYDTQIDGGFTDPFTMATGFFALVARQCHVFPRSARSPKEAEFFLTVFTAFLENLEDDNLITEDESRAKMFEAMAWASRAGWKPTQQIGPLFD